MSNELLADYWTRRELAEMLGQCERTIQRWIAIGDHPPVTHIGHEQFFRKDAAAAWLLAREKAPVRQNSKRRAA